MTSPALIEFYQFLAICFLGTYALAVLVAAALTPIVMAWSGIRAMWRWWTQS